MAEDEVDEDAWLTQLRAALAETTADRPAADDVDPLERLEAVVATDTGLLDPADGQAGDPDDVAPRHLRADGGSLDADDGSLADRLTALEQRLVEFEERQRELVKELAAENLAATESAVAEIRQLLFGSFGA